MPAALSYPGVYIEEIPSGVRTITGVATSIAAFIGWAARGPTDKAQLVLSFQDYVRNYGGLDARTYLGYTVNQFFANGGNTAYVVRLAANDAKAADVTSTENLSLRPKARGHGPRITRSPPNNEAMTTRDLASAYCWCKTAPKRSSSCFRISR